MTPDSCPLTPGADDPRVVRAVEEYLDLRQAGKKPDRREFLARYPDLAGVLAECLDGLEFIRQAGSELHQAMPPPGEASEEVSLGTPLGDFRLLREVGRGGMGVVYEAEQLSLKRRVALKVLPFAAALDPRQLQRFRHEAEAAASLHHTHIVPVHGIGCERGVHYYAMQYIEGQSLAQVIRELRRSSGLDAPNEAGPGQPGSFAREPAAGGGLSHPFSATPTGDSRANPASPSTVSLAALATQDFGSDPAYYRTVARLGVQAAEALEYAHQAGVVHRDIKPANLLVEAPGKLWITDFGLARLRRDANLTHTGDLVGTLRYMSPEQALGRRAALDHRTDIYSLGLTLYELLALRLAFPGAEREQLLRQIGEQEPAAPRRLCKGVPAELETVVLKAMAKEPAERYATAQELADDLRRFLDNRPVRARRPSLAQRLTKWAGRHRAGVAAAAVVLVLAVVALATFAGLLWQEKERTRTAYESEARAHGEMVNAFTAEAKALQARTAAHEAEQQARAAEAEQRRRAERNLRLAMAALDDLCLPLAERELPRDPHREAEFRRLVEKALAFYEQFIQANDSAPGVRYETGCAYRRVGDLHLHLGDAGKAIAAYGRALVLLDGLAAEVPEAAGRRTELAFTLSNLGVLLERSRRFAEAEEVHRLALALRVRLMEQAAAEPARRQEVGVSLNNLGIVLIKVGRTPEAEAVWREALTHREKLAGEHPGAAKYRKELASTRHNLASLYLGLGKPRDAEPLFRQAHEALEELTAKSADPDTRAKLASTLNNLGGLLAQTRRPQEAEKAYRQAAGLCEKLIAEFPTVPDYRHDLGLNLNHLGNVLAQLNRPQDAQQTLLRAVTILEQIAEAPSAPARFREALATSLVNLGAQYADLGRAREAELAYRRALELRQKLADEFPGAPENRARLAFVQQNLGMLLQATGRPQEAEPVCESARLLLKRLAAEQPHVPEYQHRLAALLLTLAGLRLDAGRLAEATGGCRESAAHAKRLADRFPGSVEYRRLQARAQRQHGSLLVEQGQQAEAAEVYRGARGVVEGLVADHPRATVFQDELAWLLATCPLPELRDASKAVELARTAAEQAPKTGAYWTTLGVARCRAESWKEAAAALERSIQLTDGGDSVDRFFLAMAQWHLGDKDAARQNFDRGCQWMEKRRPRDLELRRFRAEAAGLLGVAEPTPGN